MPKPKTRFLEAGREFGDWTVVEDSIPGLNALCVCVCGTRKQVNRSNLLRGLSISCGCHKSKASSTHGMSKTITYKSWQNMHARCLNPNNQAYPYYGGAGIVVCERWMKFENFLADMGERPSSLHSIERENNK